MHVNCKTHVVKPERTKKMPIWRKCSGTNHANHYIVYRILHDFSIANSGWWCVFVIHSARIVRCITLYRWMSARSSPRRFLSSFLTQQPEIARTVTPNWVSNLHTSGVWLLLESNVFWPVQYDPIRSMHDGERVRQWDSVSRVVSTCRRAPFIFIQIILLLIMCDVRSLCRLPFVAAFKRSIAVCAWMRWLLLRMFLLSILRLPRRKS